MASEQEPSIAPSAAVEDEAQAAPESGLPEGVIDDRSVREPAPMCRRGAPRVPWNSRIEIVWLDRFDDGPLVYQASDVSETGVALISPGMIHKETEGIALVQARSGKYALRGIRALHCRYEQELHAHVTGGQWIALPPEHNRLLIVQIDGVWRITMPKKPKAF